MTKVTFGDFLVFVLLSVVTFGIYTLWWQYSRIEGIYRTQREGSSD